MGAKQVVTPAADHATNEAILVYNGSGAEIAANRIVAVTRFDGGRMWVEPADATSAAQQPLLVTKHKIPASSYGIVLPWLAVENFACEDSRDATGKDGDITAQPAAASVLTVSSSDAGDTDVDIVVYGIDADGTAITETITTDGTDGTTPVDGVKAFASVHGVEKAATTGTITIEDDDPATIVTLLAAATSAGFATGIADQAAGGISFVADAATTAELVLVGTDASGAAQLEAITLDGTTEVESALTWGTWTKFAFGAVPAARTVTITAEIYADSQDELYVGSAGRVTTRPNNDGTDYPVGVCVGDSSSDSATGAILFPGFCPAGSSLARAFDTLATTSGAGLVGILDALSTITATTVEAALAELSNRVRTQLVTCTLTPGAEAANVIAVTLNVVDLNGTAVSRAQRVKLTLYEITMIPALAAAATLAETGAGSEITTTANASLIILTDANGDATVSVTDAAGASSKTFVLEAVPIGVSGTYTHGTPTYALITFDGA